MKAESGEVTRLLGVLRSGNREAEEQLFQLLYSELRRLAAAKLRVERVAHTLTPTALVHEAYIRLSTGEQNFEDRAQFFAVAATAMRRVLVDHARSRLAQKRGGAPQRVDLDDINLPLAKPESAEGLVALDEALERLSEMSPRQGKVVEMRYFAGLSEGEIASLLGVTPRTIDRDWQMARAWLYQCLRE